MGFGLAKAAMLIGPVITGFKLFNAVLIANPIGLVVGAIAGAVALIYMYWEPITEFFGKLWDTIEARFSLAFEFVRKTIDAIGGAISWVSNLFGDDDAPTIAVKGNKPTITKSPLHAMTAKAEQKQTRGDVNQFARDLQFSCQFSAFSYQFLILGG